MDDDQRRDDNKARFLTVLETVSAGRFEDLGQSMTDDLVFELPYGPSFIPNPVVGLEAWNEMQLMTFALFSSFRLELIEFHDCVDPDELIAEYRSEATVVRNGNDYRNRYIGVLRFRDGRISHWREFHDPQATSVL
jgi:ketosteroid isomerase-like protein